MIKARSNRWILCPIELYHILGGRQKISLKNFFNRFFLCIIICFLVIWQSIASYYYPIYYQVKNLVWKSNITTSSIANNRNLIYHQSLMSQPGCVSERKFQFFPQFMWENFIIFLIVRHTYHWSGNCYIY